MYEFHVSLTSIKKHALLIPLIIIFLFGCGDNKESKENKNPADTSAVQTTTESNQKTDTVASPLTVYKNHIPEPVINYINTALTDWSLPSPESWEKYWWDQYKKEKTLVNFISGDFNCDQKIDYAVVLRDKDSTTGAWVLMAKDSSYTRANLEMISKEPGFIGIGLELMQKGKQADLNGDHPKTINAKCEGVTIVFFEKAAHSWYWEKGKWKMIYTAD